MVVFAFGLAFKIPSVFEWRLFLHGLIGNMQERTFSGFCPDKLCPLLFSLPGGFLNVMPECKPLSSEFYLDEFDFDDFCACDEGADVSGIVEDKRDSFGVLGNRIVAVDYGG